MSTTYRVGQTIQLRASGCGHIVSIHHTPRGTELVLTITGTGRDSTIRNLRVREDGSLTVVRPGR